jgi:hypothetical protein
MTAFIGPGGAARTKPNTTPTSTVVAIEGTPETGRRTAKNAVFECDAATLLQHVSHRKHLYQSPRLVNLRRLLPSVLVAAALVAVLAAGSEAVTASPQPDPVCTVCDHPRIDDDAVVETRVTIDIRENGDAAWQIRVDIRDESVADDLRERPLDLSSSSGTALVDDDAVDPTATVTDDDTLVVTFVHEDAARPASAGRCWSTTSITRAERRTSI